VIWAVMQWLAIGLFVACSALISTNYMLDTFEAYGVIAWGFAGFALAIELLKPVSVRAAFGAQGWRYVLLGTLGALVCVATSSYWELQVVARGRAAYVEKAGAEKAKAAADDLGKRRKELSDELETIEPARTERELEPLIVAGTRDAGDCSVIRTTMQRDACRSLPQLKSEAGRAQRIGALKQQIAALDTKAKTIVPEATAEARSIAAAFERFGLTVPADQIDRLLGPVMVGLLQAGAVVAAAIKNAAPSVPQSVPGVPWLYWLTPWRNSTKTLGTIVSERVSGDCPDEATENDRSEQEERARILAVLEAAGGSIEGGQRGLAKQCGTSVQRWRKTVSQLASEGRVKVSAGTRGTKVEIIR